MPNTIDAVFFGVLFAAVLGCSWHQRNAGLIGMFTVLGVLRVLYEWVEGSGWSVHRIEGDVICVVVLALGTAITYLRWRN